MTKLLEQAIEKLRALPDEDQDALASHILSDLDGFIEPLDDKTRAAIQEGLAQARRGEFVPDEEMKSFWKSHGL